MRVFVTYARLDAGAITGIEQAVERIGDEMWFDNQFSGGQQWCTVIREPSASGKGAAADRALDRRCHELHSGLA